MKKRIIIGLSLFAGILAGMAACNKKLPQSQSQGTVLQSNYYQNPAEALNGIVAAYNPLSWTTVSSYCPKMVIFNAGIGRLLFRRRRNLGQSGHPGHQYLYVGGCYAQCSTGPLEP
jgi:hypothetical protein